jgi:hypothetical protein
MSGVADVDESGGTDEPERLFLPRESRTWFSYTVKRDAMRLWSVCRMRMRSQLAAVIELARSVAHDKHVGCARSVRVEFHNVSSVIRLGSHDRQPVQERVSTW